MQSSRLALGRDDKYSFLRFLEKIAEFVLGQAPAREILQNVDRSEAAVFRAVQCGVCSEKIAAEGGVDLLRFSGNPLAIRASRPMGGAALENLANILADNGRRLE